MADALALIHVETVNSMKASRILRVVDSTVSHWIDALTVRFSCRASHAGLFDVARLIVSVLSPKLDMSRHFTHEVSCGRT